MNFTQRNKDNYGTMVLELTFFVALYPLSRCVKHILKN